MSAKWKLGTALLIGGAVMDSFCTLTPIPKSDTSMRPIIDCAAHSAERCLVFVFKKSWKDLETNDLVLIRDPTRSHGKLIRRLGGVERQWVKRDEMHISMSIPPGHCAIFQDNPENNIIDTRTFGTIPLRMIDGKAIAIVWPPRMIKLIK